MENLQNLETIKKSAREIIQRMGFETEITANFDAVKNLLLLEIKTIGLDDSGFLIGHNGEILFALQHVISQFLRKKTGQLFFLDLDINSYKRKRSEYLRDLAKEIANQVSLSKKPVTLEPMRPYERRIVHMELAERSDVVTESVGEGPERSVQIKPRS